MKKLLKKLGFIKAIEKSLNTEMNRDLFVIRELSVLANNQTLLDAGCGSQRYKKYCSHLIYKTQDLGEYESDIKDGISNNVENLYKIGPLDYKGNIWEIPADSNSFDVILCTEVLEHIPYPNETIKEFSRLLKSNGKLILTVPAFSNRHFDPYYFYSGFSDRWIESILGKNSFRDLKILPVADYFRCQAIEIHRTMITNSWIAKIILGFSFLYFYFKKPTTGSINYQCVGYHVTAIKE